MHIFASILLLVKSKGLPDERSNLSACFRMIDFPSILFSTLKIDGGIQCMLIPLHPKFAITLVPNDYYKKMIEKQGEEKYLKIDDEKNLLQLNFFICSLLNFAYMKGFKNRQYFTF